MPVSEYLHEEHRKFNFACIGEVVNYFFAFFALSALYFSLVLLSSLFWFLLGSLSGYMVYRNDESERDMNECVLLIGYGAGILGIYLNLYLAYPLYIYPIYNYIININTEPKFRFDKYFMTVIACSLLFMILITPLELKLGSDYLSNDDSFNITFNITDENDYYSYWVDAFESNLMIVFIAMFTIAILRTIHIESYVYYMNSGVRYEQVTEMTESPESPESPENNI